MIIPKKLKIGGFDWEVGISHEVAFEGNVYGTTHISDQKIYISPDMPNQKQAHTLLHEILHASVFSHGQTHLFKNSDEEERVVAALSIGLYQVLKDNPLIFCHDKEA